MVSFLAKGQRIVIDTASTNKYIIKKEVKEPAQPREKVTAKEEVSFGERALSIGNGILNRLKARLNLEEAAESIKQKGGRLVKGNADKSESESASDNGGG